MNNGFSITILGGGPAGLAVGYYAKKRGFPFVIYEASAQVGGNAVTLRCGDFRFDSGAHRFHQKDLDVTEALKALLGKGFKHISVPSHIWHEGKCIDFPFSPLDMMVKLGPLTFLRAMLKLLQRRLEPKCPDGSFEGFALRTYGDILARRFLLNYSEKLWGRPPHELSRNISGTRLNGLGAKTLMKEVLLGKNAKTVHLDGAFYYPETGYGTIAEKLADVCGEGNIRKSSRVTRIFHNHGRIRAVEINDGKLVDVNQVVSTLPLPLLVRLMDPQPKEEILALAGEFRFRDLIIVALFLNRDSVTRSGTVYFPDLDVPFTRVYEPSNRSRAMSPPGQTSLCAEIPCYAHDARWRMTDRELIDLTGSYLIRIGWIKGQDIIDARAIRLSHAYPVLQVGCEEKLKRLHGYLDRFNNLKGVGRNAKFLHSSVHDMMRSGIDVVEEYARAGVR